MMKNFHVKQLFIIVGIPLLSFVIMGLLSPLLGMESSSEFLQVENEGFGRDLKDEKVKSPLGFQTDPGPPTDGQIEGAINRRLDMDSRIAAGKIGVKVEDHQVTLFGTADTIREKKLAALIAGSVSGVSAVRNDLMVKPALSEDDRIKRDAEQMMKPIEMKKGNRLTVKVENGVVTLGGEVLDQPDVRVAELAVEHISGVANIKNMIRVVKKNRADDAIEEDVIAYLMSSPLFQGDNLTVHVQNGIVSLQGAVDHMIYRNVLQIDIENIQGVKEVRVGKVIPKRFEAMASTDRDKKIGK